MNIVNIIEPPIATYKILNVDELNQRLQACHQSQFTGRLDIHNKTSQSPQWSLFFRGGSLVGGTSVLHSVRRWHRQLSLYCPQLLDRSREGTDLSQNWNQQTLVGLVQQGKMSQEQVVSVVAGNLVEILFDLMQLYTLQFDRLMHLTYRQLPSETAITLPIRISPALIWQKASQQWETWQQAGLGSWSPNWAPVIWDAEELRRQTSLLVYHNLTTIIDGDRTLRDLAAKLKQPLVSLALSLLPYIRKGIMGLVEVRDWNYQTQSTHSSPPITPPPVQVLSSSPLVAYIEDSRFDCIAMNQILAQAGYRFINVRDPVQALPILIEQNPGLIFLDLIMPVTNGYEVCGQLRRVSMFRNTPIIIVTSSDGIVDRVRAKLVNSSGFISKPIESKKVLSVLHHHLPLTAP
ncbi:response regulator [Thermocoleostomius sinensis]|uniref:Response regulator n=1 Tax=Thermocoleostomius sinensis A174 TaxID=2016057 RepID=A0A9E8ZE54_9CYAN|nr:response regulator [Thermocoleostomius sinensis]WAL61483.1 response regulator [Thermocoleostomius sinensis A174]